MQAHRYALHVLQLAKKSATNLLLVLQQLVRK